MENAIVKKPAIGPITPAYVKPVKAKPPAQKPE